MARNVKSRIELWNAGMFPVMTGKDYCREEGACVPLALVLPHEKQAQRNHSQTLHRLAERGGLSACELAAVLEDREWTPIEEHEGWAAIFRAAAQCAQTEVAKPTELQVQAGAVILATTPLIDAPKQLTHAEWMGLSREILEAAQAIQSPPAQPSGMALALRNLMKESAAIMALCEPQLREAAGSTNVAVFQRRITEAGNVLDACTAAVESSQPKE